MFRNRYIISPRIEVLIASYGGVGTTFLSQAVGRFRRVNDPRDLDGYKHCPVPPLLGNEPLKVVYVIGNPILAAASLFRRRYHVGQAGKLQYSRILRQSPRECLSLEEFSIQGRDLFYFEEHVQAWTSEFVFYPTLVVKYDAIHENIKQIASFLDLPDQFIDEFPFKSERGCSIANIDRETLNRMNKLYGGLASKIDLLPPISTLRPSKSQATAIFDQRYWIGALRDSFWNLAQSSLCAFFDIFKKG